ncbi:hypothetical protein PAESOLCIP111_02084 [Paenibacillus solanacearum]|uniref:PA14 domain-containing protein n=1 Tax=Paenibacillus solanacearum TaxID=2048548 RepID=A0A916NP90_9BACL|nr:hypothetical protein [Paenibacillus solanacearum]CAG7618113.1 hypothetical protein PAESOLCIP111_02084 [Paenibacillus solanacearum]
MTNKYAMTMLLSLLIVVMAATLGWSRPPIQGIVEREASADPLWTAGYIGGPASGDLSELLERLPQLSLVAGPAPAAAADRMGKPWPRHYFPVPAAGGAASDDAARFPHIPEDQLPGYGRSAYFVDFGAARFWFMNAARLASEPEAQLEWLKRTAAADSRAHRIVLLASEPAQPEVWQGLADSGVDLVLIGPRLYVPESAVTERPATGYRSSARRGWAEWTVSGGDSPPLLTIEGRGSRLAAAVYGEAGRQAGRLALDAAGLRHTAAVQERAPVAIGATWHYRAGSAEVRAAIPPQLDPAGERPIEGRFTLPPSDWRSPAYDDADWTWGSAPFGRTRSGAERSGIRTALPATPASPAYYFRKTFVLEEDPAAYTDWQLHVAFEDGFIAYINGTEVARDSIREGLVDYRSLASPHEHAGFESFSLNGHKDVLVQGVNTIAVQVHGSHPDSPEFRFDASLSGAITLKGEAAP